MRKRTAGREAISIQWFVEGQLDRGKLVGELVGARPECDQVLKNWTFVNQEFDVRLHQTRHALLINTVGRSLRQAETITWKMGSDLPPGDYRLRLSAPQNLKGYPAAKSR